MTQRSKNGDESAASKLARFVQHEVAALSEAFSSGPLMQLRVRTPRGDVTLVKAAAQPAQAAETEPPEEHHRSAHALHDYLPDGEPGHAYDMINADVVGIFHAAADSPALGEPIEEGRTLGYIEALKVRTPVRAGVSGTLVGQVAEDGQAVDFGETLFIVDSTPAQAAPQTGVAPEEAEALEPPRI